MRRPEQSRLLKLGAIVLIVAATICTVSQPAVAQSNEAEISVLPPATGDLVPVAELGICECPADLDVAQPSRGVVQYIEGTLYSWREYDVPDGTCLRLELPEERALTLAEAQALLTASRQWVLQAIAADPNLATVLDPADPRLNLPGINLTVPPGYVPSAADANAPDEAVSGGPVGPDKEIVPLAGSAEGAPESVCGTDDRTRVTSFTSTQVYPWYTIGYISNSYAGGGSFRGTGFLVTPCVALTNGHMVYDQGLNQWAATWNFSPGQYENPPGGAVVRPFGTAASTSLHSNTSWTGGGGPEYDYGSAYLDTNFSNQITTYMPLIFDYTPPTVNRAGYGATVNGASTRDQWHSYDASPTVNGRMLEYMMDTSGGSSGSPVWELSGGNRTVNTIHGYGGCPNSGPRLVSQNQAVITGWMQHTCPPVCEADQYEPNDGDATATPISAGATQTHSIFPIGDADWLTFTLSTESEVILETSGPSGDTRMWLYDSALTQLEYNDDGGASLFSLIDRTCGADTLPAGTYYVKIDEFGNNATICEYSITLTVNCCADTFEPDNTSGQASTLVPGTAQTAHSICPIGESDWMTFTLAAESEIVLETSGPSGDTRMWLYNSGLTQLEYNDDGGAGLFSRIDRVCDADALPAGTYYVEIDEFGDNAAIGNYDILLTVVQPCVTDPTITWVTGPPTTAAGGDPIPLTWNLAGFGGPITENVAHWGISSVLGSSPAQPGSNGNHSWTFNAPNIGTFDSPETFGYIVRALDSGAQVLGPPASCQVSAGQNPPTVSWVTRPPGSASSGQTMNVSWQLANYDAPATTNAFAFGITTILGQTCNQPGGNGTYNCAWVVPPLTGSGTVYFTAYAENAYQFAFSTPVGVVLSP